MNEKSIHVLMEQARALPPAEKLRAAADLLDAGAVRLASALARLATTEICTAELLLRPPTAGPDPREVPVVEDDA